MIDPVLAAALDDLCTRNGSPPWEVWRRPYLHTRAEKVHALMAAVRADAQAAQGLRPRDRHGRYVSRRGDGGG